MKRIPIALLALLALSLGVALAAPQSPTVSSAAGGSLNVSRVSVTLHSSGATAVALVYTTASGQQVHTRTVTVPSDCAQPILDANGVQLAASVPAGLCSAISSFASQIDSTIASAAAAGKLAL